MLYHVDIINLYRSVLRVDPTTDWARAQLDHARNIASTSLRALLRLLKIQERAHGWTDAITLVLHPITVASFGIVEEIHALNCSSISLIAPDDETHLGLLTCLRALEQLSNYSYYAQPLFRLLVQKCQSLGLQMPAGIQRSLAYYTSEEWTKEASLLVSSQYIADIRTEACSAESARMDAVISTWERLSFDEAGKGKARAA